MHFSKIHLGGCLLLFMQLHFIFHILLDVSYMFLEIFFTDNRFWIYIFRSVVSPRKIKQNEMVHERVSLRYVIICLFYHFYYIISPVKILGASSKGKLWIYMEKATFVIIDYGNPNVVIGGRYKTLQFLQDYAEKANNELLKLQGRISTLEAELPSYRSATIQKHSEFTPNQPFKQAHVMPQSILSSIGIV